MWKRWLVGIMAVYLAACAAAPSEPPIEQSPGTSLPGPAYPSLGPAPEIIGDVWLNTDAPLRLANLQGKVVLIDMWTFG